MSHLTIERIRLLEEKVRERDRMILWLENRVAEATGMVTGDRRRRKYPDATKRDPASGRLMVKCLRCGDYKPLRGRGMCSRCYKRWYKRTRERRRLNDKIGGIPLTAADVSRILAAAEGGPGGKAVTGLGEETILRYRRLA